MTAADGITVMRPSIDPAKAIHMLRDVRAALEAAYDYEYPLDYDPAEWMVEARRALVLSKRFLSRTQAEGRRR